MTSFNSRTKLNKLKEVKKKNGFTLVEMMAVVAIAGVLSAMGLPALTEEIGKAQDSATITTLTNAAKECSLSLIAKGDDSNYLDSTTSEPKPFDARFVNVTGKCEVGGMLTLNSPKYKANNTRTAEIRFVDDIPQTPKFRTEATS